MNKIIDIKEARELVEYFPETGLFLFKKSSPHHFTDGYKGYTAEHKAAVWNRSFGGKPAFTTLTPTNYYKGYLLRKQYLAHRFAWFLMTGKWPEGEIDHQNGIPSDNRWINLRDVDRLTNGKNQKRRNTNTSGRTGVGWHEGSKRWRAYIEVNYKFIGLGTYKNIEEAISAREKAEIEYGFHKNHDRVLEVSE